jgi:hypothetical protein
MKGEMKRGLEFQPPLNPLLHKEGRPWKKRRGFYDGK